MNTIQIGNQTWATENLNISNFRNGDKIPIVDNFLDWASFASKNLPCCAYVDNKQSMSKYGLLYNGFCVKDSRNIAPEGFKVPNVKDILNLTHYLGFDNSLEDRVYYNPKVGEGLKSEKTWKKSFFGEPGNNSTRLNFLGGGNLSIRNGAFLFADRGYTANHWLSDEHIPAPQIKFFPPPPDGWSNERLFSFSIGSGGDHSLSVGDDFLYVARFIRLVKSD